MRRKVVVRVPSTEETWGTWYARGRIGVGGPLIFTEQMRQAIVDGLGRCPMEARVSGGRMQFGMDGTREEWEEWVEWLARNRREVREVRSFRRLVH